MRIFDYFLRLVEQRLSAATGRLDRVQLHCRRLPLKHSESARRVQEDGSYRWYCRQFGALSLFQVCRFFCAQHKLQELRVIQRYCVENKLRCVFLSCPVHASAYIDLQKQMQKFFAGFPQFDQHFHLDLSAHEFPNTWMGDTIDHIEPERKAETTKLYWANFSQYVQD
ncbi:MAG: hypothetical protein V4623_02355 [Pseudomonadota bacterium]